MAYMHTQKFFDEVDRVMANTKVEKKTPSPRIVELDNKTGAVDWDNALKVAYRGNVFTMKQLVRTTGGNLGTIQRFQPYKVTVNLAFETKSFGYHSIEPFDKKQPTDPNKAWRIKRKKKRIY